MNCPWDESPLIPILNIFELSAMNIFPWSFCCSLTLSLLNWLSYFVLRGGIEELETHSYILFLLTNVVLSLIASYMEASTAPTTSYLVSNILLAFPVLWSVSDLPPPLEKRLFANSRIKLLLPCRIWILVARLLLITKQVQLSYIHARIVMKVCCSSKIKS